MKVRILPDKCRGHAMCVLACPEVFKLDDETGLAFIPDGDVPPDLAEPVRQAQESCPEEAIDVVD
ncbi:MAG: ferredoxin [Sphingomonadaceae bacterium]|nr:ferredoxin [Sphingomonadaceae bacterium]